MRDPSRPQALSSRRRRRPPWRYAELLEAIDDAKHERHAELKDSIGGTMRSMMIRCS